MAENLIRWKKSDYLRLGKAVSDFNKKVREITTDINKSYMPDLTSYKYEKERIKSRRELERIIKVYRDFLNPKNRKIIETEAGDFITIWENKRIIQESKIAINTLNKDIKVLESEVPTWNLELNSLKRNLSSIENLSSQTREQQKRIKRRIHNLGSYDYKIAKALIYRENFMNAFKDIENLYGAKYLKEKLDSIKNPITFFNYTQKSKAFADLFLWYDVEGYGGFKSKQSIIDTIAVELGLFDEMKNKLINKSLKNGSSKQLINDILNINDYEDYERVIHSDLYYKYFKK